MNNRREQFWKVMPIVFWILFVASVAVWFVMWRGLHTLPPAEYLRVAEQEKLRELNDAEEAINRQDMAEPCAQDGILRTTRSGLVVICKNKQWVKMSLGVKGADGVIRQVPPDCGPLAHVENHPEFGPLCIQNEGKWTTAKDNTPQETPCLAGTTTTRDGKLLSCQDDVNWKQAPQQNKP